MDLLHEYIAEGEHQTQDFKFRVDDPRKIARTLVAFANTDGGRLLIGVKDNGKVAGVDPEEEFHIIEGAAHLYCKPKVAFETKVWQDEHKLVLEVYVPPASKRPVKAKDDDDNWKVYVRRSDHTLIGNKILLGLWSQKNKEVQPPQKFSDEESTFLKTIEDLQPITLSKLYRNSELSKNVIDKLLIRFILWKIVKMDITPEGTFYNLQEEVV